jgi:dTDP-4-dehydrorhamnose reductase
MRGIQDFSLRAGNDTAVVAEVLTAAILDVDKIESERANCLSANYQAPYITSRICFEVSGVSMPLAWSSARQIRLQKAMTA